MEQLEADVMVGPLSGDEAVAIANYAKQHPTKTFIIGTAGVAGPDDADRAEELLPLPRRRRPVERGHRRDRLQEARLAEGRDHHGRLQLRLDVRGRHHRRLLRDRRQDHEARVPAAQHDRLLVRTSSSCPQPDKVDGYFWVVGGTGTGAASRRSSRRTARSSPKQLIGNLFFDFVGAPTRKWRRMYVGAYVGGFGTAPGLKTAQAKTLRGRSRASGTRRCKASLRRRVRLQLLQRRVGARPGALRRRPARPGRSSRRRCRARSRRATRSRDKGRRQARQPAAGDPGPVPAADRQARAAHQSVIGFVPNVDQTFGGMFGPNKPAPGRTCPPCVKKKLPWQGKIKVVKNGVVTNQVIK